MAGASLRKHRPATSHNSQAEFMMTENTNQPGEGSSRRTFLKTTSAMVGGAVLGGVSAQGCPRGSSGRQR